MTPKQLEKFKAAQLKKNEKYSKKREQHYKQALGKDILPDGENKKGRPR